MKSNTKTIALAAFVATLYSGLGLDALVSYSIAAQDDESVQCEDKPFKAFKKIRNFSHKKSYKPLTLNLVKKVKKKVKSKPCIDIPKRTDKTNIETAQYIEPQIETALAPKIETGIPEQTQITQLNVPDALDSFKQQNTPNYKKGNFEGVGYGLYGLFSPNYLTYYPYYVGSSRLFVDLDETNLLSPTPSQVPSPATLILLIPGLVYLWKKRY